MAERVHVREITNDEGNRLLRTVRRSSGSVVTWRRAHIVLLSAQGMDVPAIAQVTFTSADRVRDVIHNSNTDGFDSLRPRYAGGRPLKFDLAQWAPVAAGTGTQSAPRRRRRRATYKRPHGVRHLLAGYGLSTDRLYGHVKTHKGRAEFLAFARYQRSLHRAHVRIAIVLDRFSAQLYPHRRPGRSLGPGQQRRTGRRPVLRLLTQQDRSPVHRPAPLRLDGTDHPSHEAQASMIRRYIRRRNQHTHNQLLRRIGHRAEVIKKAKVA